MTALNAFHRRKLTSGEIALAQSVYQGSLNYERIRIHKGKLIPFLQYNRVAMSPFGTMHFPKSLYQNDFSQASISARHLFIHEMAHIWQHQLGLRLWLDGAILGAKGGYKNNECYAYAHRVNQCEHFSQFNMEQQADLIADWFVFQNTQNNPQIQKIMRDFIDNPNNVALLPTHAEFRFQAA
ncbi:type IV secretion protein Rhs [Alysiella filiformis]|uniref:Type IV secretion protein Rhs n=1 Tax=Alysiella filiformis DSM 16848 TaxID=1120981 RepID=A0A286EG72_9NEIS|nr:type IV secretion protein Rhs [Alysiella filiformis]QMT31238.1 type IV secretion protein Rhs [Alysiella filiformis]UBQ55761.1 type IV secretion protein Rhs [Alysiella filiformis DSM 16848]SOD69829.1 hypothetical protein SAMN02746062_01850 [Alysiella filiformis DSM 16848]